jgi:hypothetical protein
VSWSSTKSDIITISSKYNLFSTLYSWKIAYLVLNSNKSLTRYNCQGFPPPLSLVVTINMKYCLKWWYTLVVQSKSYLHAPLSSYKFTSHIAAFLSVVLITEMLEICIQTSYDQNIQLILKSYLPVVYGTPLRSESIDWLARNQDNVSKWRDDLHMDSCFSELTLYKANSETSPQIDMSPHSDTLSWFPANQSLLFLLNAACLAKRQQIPIS